jgi:hypothetical protein
MAQTDESDTLSQNRIFDLLSNARRRFVLHYLSQQDGPVELRELADEVARWETGSDSLTRKERKRVYVSLYQTHIPRLADAGVIAYDTETGQVQLVDRARDLDRYITSADDRSWPQYYLAIAAAGTAFYLLVVFDVVPFISDVVGGLLVLGVLLIVALAHVISIRLESNRLKTDAFVPEREE